LIRNGKTEFVLTEANVNTCRPDNTNNQPSQPPEQTNKQASIALQSIIYARIDP
jgi:hypothetical protein